MKLVNYKALYFRNSNLLLAVLWLFTISFVIDHYWSGTAGETTVQHAVQSDVQLHQKEFRELCSDTSLTSRLIMGQYDEKVLKDFIKKKFFFYIYKATGSGEDEPVFWNTQIVHPDIRTNFPPVASNLVKLQNGWYVTESKRLASTDSATYYAVTLIPIKWDYYINNKYLRNSFNSISNVENEYQINSRGTSLPIKDIDGIILFGLDHTIGPTVIHNNEFAILLRLIAALLVLIFIHIEANIVVLKRGLFKGFLFLFFPVLILRVISYAFPIPLNFRQLELFDPSIYGSNPVLRSLGDLFLNSLLFVWMILFIRYHLQEKNFAFKPKNDKERTGIIILISVAMICFTLLFAHIIRSLVADSQISFDVINFYTLNIYSVFGFFVLCCIATGYFFLMQIILVMVKSLTGWQQSRLYFALAICALVLETFRYSNMYVSFEILILIWLMICVFLMNRVYLNLPASKIIASRLIFWIFFFSVSITIIIVSQNQGKELLDRKAFAENLANKADPSGERMLNSVLTDFHNDFLSDVFSRFYKSSDNKFLKDSLINENTSGYLNKYETKIYTFDADGSTLYNQDSTNFNTLNAVVETQARPTAIPGLLYYDVSFDHFNYISKKAVTDPAGKLKGYVFILSKPKKYKSDALYPELFSKGNANSIESSPLYAFAIYNNNKLSSSYNDYSFPTMLPAKAFASGQSEVIRNKDYTELWYRANATKSIIIAKQESVLLESLTLFAYLFFVFLAVAAILRILNLFIDAKFDPEIFRSFLHVSIRNQIHGTILLISLFSFIIIGVATIIFFTKRYHSNNREKLSRTIHVMENDVLGNIAILPGGKQSDSTSHETFDILVNKIAEVHSADLNIYDLNGNLLESSLPLPYTKGIVSKKMDPMAFYHLSRLKDAQFFQEQMIGKLKYLNDYAPIRDENGEEYAYLNIPYFESQSKLEDEISNFLVTLINLNAFIFIVAGIIALFITNRITSSFAFISNKMKEVNLGKVNEEITWQSKDEIGELVAEYNKMVKKLDTSAELLARSEREGAWREMARQVAHEIKNPLTPMKLNLQYLQRAIDNNSPNVKTISIYVAKILVEQIDHLSQIASDFAQFANIGQSNNQVFNINDSLNQVVALMSTNEKVNITLRAEQANTIRADKTQINRLFTNLLQNAMQSIPENKMGMIEIETTSAAANVLVSVTDNGVGISAQMQGKIFTPNFTTKTSGTGLGLAMCKGIVEKCNGRIWFETIEGVRTTFFIELPLVS